MTHRRSKEKEQLRQVRRLIFSRGFHDRVKGETVCKLSRIDVLGLLNEPVQLSIVPDLERGEILIDSRGRGSFQR